MKRTFIIGGAFLVLLVGYLLVVNISSNDLEIAEKAINCYYQKKLEQNCFFTKLKLKDFEQLYEDTYAAYVWIEDYDCFNSKAEGERCMRIEIQPDEGCSIRSVIIECDTLFGKPLSAPYNFQRK